MYTKGPWRAEPKGQRFCIRLPARRGIGEQIAQHIIDRDDANLIAAAPEMFEALEAALAQGYNLPITRIQAALAKARGET